MYTRAVHAPPPTLTTFSSDVGDTIHADVADAMSKSFQNQFAPFATYNGVGRLNAARRLPE